MGQIVVYKLPMSGSPYHRNDIREQRQQGMIDFGQQIRDKLGALGNNPNKPQVAAAIEEAIFALSESADPKYMVRYDFQSNHGGGPAADNQLAVRNIGNKPKLHTIETNGTLTELNRFLKIEISPDGGNGNDFNVGVATPARENQPDIWNYIDDVVRDLEHIRIDNPGNFAVRQREYLISRLSFSRCM